jgi:hypothetical protein
MQPAELHRLLAGLDEKASSDLRSAWSRVTGCPSPQVSPKMLRLALAWEIQCRLHGGLSRRAGQRLDQIAGGRTRTREARPGMRLVREWNGVVHVVTVAGDGTIEWNGKAWKSLSEIARAITGTRWSGPAFFGLRQKRNAA